MIEWPNYEYPIVSNFGLRFIGRKGFMAKLDLVPIINTSNDGPDLWFGASIGYSWGRKK